MGRKKLYFGRDPAILPEGMPDPDLVPDPFNLPIPLSDYDQMMQHAIRLKERYLEERRRSHRSATSKYQKLNTKAYSLVLNLDTDRSLIELLDQAKNRTQLFKAALLFWREHEDPRIRENYLKLTFEP